MAKRKVKRVKRANTPTVPTSSQLDLCSQHSPESYTIDLDRLDLGLLAIESLLEKFSSKDSGAVVLWQPLSQVNDEYQPFTVYAARDCSPKDDDLKADQQDDHVQRKQPNVLTTSMPLLGMTRCHICSTDIPTDFTAQHNHSTSHKTLSKLAHSALHRLNRHYQQPGCFATDQTKETKQAKATKETSDTHYCILCNVTVKKTQVQAHNTGTKHRGSVKRDEQLTELCLVYVVNDLEIRDEPDSNTAALQHVTVKVLGEKDSATVPTRKDTDFDGDTALFNNVNDRNLVGKLGSSHNHENSTPDVTGNRQNSANCVMGNNQDHGKSMNSALGSSQNDGKTANSVLRSSQNDGKTANSVLRSSQNDGKTANGVLRSSQNDGKTANSVLRSSQNDEKTANSGLRSSQNDGKTANSILRSSQNDKKTANNVLRISENDGKTANSVLGSENHSKTTIIVTEQNQNVAQTKNNASHVKTQPTCKSTKIPPNVYCVDCDLNIPNHINNITEHRAGKYHHSMIKSKRDLRNSNTKTQTTVPGVAKQNMTCSEDVFDSQKQSTASNLPKKPVLSASPKLPEADKQQISSGVQRNSYVERCRVCPGNPPSTLEHLNDNDHKFEVHYAWIQHVFKSTKQFMEINQVSLAANGGVLIVNLFHWHGIKARHGFYSFLDVNYECLVCDEVLPDSPNEPHEHIRSPYHLRLCQAIRRDGTRQTANFHFQHCIVCNEKFLGFSSDPRHDTPEHEQNLHRAAYAHATNVIAHYTPGEELKSGFPYAKVAMGSVIAYVAVRRLGCMKGLLVCSGAVILGKIFGY